MPRDFDPIRVAAEWHGGQWSDLYGYSSSGIITDREGLLSEIDSALSLAEDSQEVTQEDFLELEFLHDYIFTMRGDEEG